MIDEREFKQFFAEKELTLTSESHYRTMLNYLFDWMGAEGLDLAGLDTGTVKAWITSHQDWSNSTQYNMACVTRSFVRWRYGDSHQLTRLRVKRLPPGPQRTLTEDDLAKVLGSIQANTEIPVSIKRRNYALVALMTDTGLRASEACGLRMVDLDLPGRVLNVRCKGGAWQRKVFSDRTAEALLRWLEIRSRIKKRGSETVFIALKCFRGKSLTRDGLRTIFAEIGQRAGLSGFSPHDLRRTFATLSIRNGAPTRVVQKQGGWATVGMVEKYSAGIQPEDFAPYFPVQHVFEKQAEQGRAAPVKKALPKKKHEKAIRRPYLR